MITRSLLKKGRTMIKSDYSETYDNLEYKMKKVERNKETDFLSKNFLKINPAEEEKDDLSEEKIEEYI